MFPYSELRSTCFQSKILHIEKSPTLSLMSLKRIFGLFSDHLTKYRVALNLLCYWAKESISDSQVRTLSTNVKSILPPANTTSDEISGVNVTGRDNI